MTDKSFPVLTTQRLLLRQFTEADQGNVFAGLSDPDVIKYYGVSYQTLAHTKEQMDWYTSLEKNQTGFWWAICSLDMGSFYGAVGLNNLKREHNKAEIGFWLLPPFWRLGIMAESVPLVCQYGFDALGLHRIEGFVETANEASRKVFIKAGFNYEGTLSDCELKDGQYISLDIFAKLQ